MRRDDLLAVRISDAERELLEAAANKEDTSQSAIARRGAVKEARSVLAGTPTERREQ